MTALIITLKDLIHLERETTKTSLKIRKIRIAAERGDISPAQACARLKRIGISITR